MISFNPDDQILDTQYLKSGDIEYRKYQMDIAKKCLSANSLVVLPTGLGKTIIAVLVAAYTLERFPKDSKVIVLAPTRPLINQHYDMFKNLLTISEEQFTVLTGRVNPAHRAVYFQKHQILFYTPQTLRNDLVNRRYDLTTTCLIVFDEAHHASGDYPYTMIADQFIEQMPDGSILALTASPGASKTKIKELCETLHIPHSNIYSRTRADTDVKSYLKPMDIGKIGVELTDLMQDAYVVIKQFLEERLKYLAHLGFIESDKEPLNESIYRKDLLKINAELVKMVNSEGDKTGVYTALSVNAQALILFHMIDLIEQQGLDVLYTYLVKMKGDAKKKSSSKAVKILASEYRLHQVFVELHKHHELKPYVLVHPKYKVLEEILTEQIHNNPDSRILVFVKLRDSVKNIAKKLNTQENIHASRFVGQATKSKDDTGLSQKKQLEILEKFRQGEYNVLVSTNVGEEGLDIAECDLVVFYDVVASEIRFIQRKGRTARHREGKVIILYCKGTHDEIYLNITLNKLNRMNKSLKAHIKETTISPTLIKTPVSKSEDLPPNKQKQKGNLLDFMEHYSNLDFQTSPHSDIMISNRLAGKFGFRKKLHKDAISFTISNWVQHIVIHEKVLIQVFTSESFDSILQNEILSFLSAFQNKYHLIIIILDFIDFTEQLNGELRVIKQQIKQFAENAHIQIIVIEDAEELYFILKNIIQNIEQVGKNHGA